MTELAYSWFKLRVVVAALGEVVDPPWWRTEFLTPAGIRFLERLYPRTYFVAAVESTGKAAMVIHDRSVGRVGAYHLYRLPADLEIELQTSRTDLENRGVQDFSGALGDRNLLLQFLTNLGEEACPEVDQGPFRVGSGSDVHTNHGLSMSAAVYLKAFSKSVHGFPYFTLNDEV